MYNNNIIITIINKYYPTHHSAYNHNNIHAQFYSQQRLILPILLGAPTKKTSRSHPQPPCREITSFQTPLPLGISVALQGERTMDFFLYYTISFCSTIVTYPAQMVPLVLTTWTSYMEVGYYYPQQLIHLEKVLNNQ